MPPKTHSQQYGNLLWLPLADKVIVRHINYTGLNSLAFGVLRKLLVYAELFVTIQNGPKVCPPSLSNSLFRTSLLKGSRSSLLSPGPQLRLMNVFLCLSSTMKVCGPHQRCAWLVSSMLPPKCERLLWDSHLCVKRRHLIPELPPGPRWHCSHMSGGSWDLADNKQIQSEILAVQLLLWSLPLWRSVDGSSLGLVRYLKNIVSHFAL